MAGKLKEGVLRLGASSGVARLIGGTKWRQGRLLILCYHGVSRADEHDWSPELYVSPDFLDQRLRLLEQEHATVVSLDDGLHLLREGRLPPRAVALTFDDGNYDFHSSAAPILEAHGMKATVYASTYYASDQRPVFGPSTDYVLWKGRASRLPAWPEVGLAGEMDVADPGSRARVLRALRLHAEARGLGALEKDQLNEALAQRLGVRYGELRERRLFHIMTGPEMRAIVAKGHTLGLHTHRHRAPRDEQLFRREIRDNRTWLAEHVGVAAKHFCYPSGVHAPEFLPWLAAEGIVSATTCLPGLASRQDHTMLVPRFVDTSAQSSDTFRSWVNGVGHLVRRRRQLFDV